MDTRYKLRWSFISGTFFGVLIMTLMQFVGADESMRQYQGYRHCIQTPNCQMTPDDFIEYYGLEYRIVQFERENPLEIDCPEPSIPVDRLCVEEIEKEN